MSKYVYAQNGIDLYNAIADQQIAGLTPVEETPFENPYTPEEEPSFSETTEEEDTSQEDNSYEVDEHEVRMQQLLDNSLFDEDIHKAVRRGYESIFSEEEQRINNEKVGYSPNNQIDSRVSSAMSELLSKFPELRVTSTIRSAEENKKVGGVKNSKHLTGHAGDVSFSPEAYSYYNNFIAPKYGLERAPSPNHGTAPHIHIETMKSGGKVSKYTMAQDGLDFLSPTKLTPLVSSFNSNQLPSAASGISKLDNPKSLSTSTDSLLSKIPTIGKYLGLIKGVSDFFKERTLRKREEQNQMIRGLTAFNNLREGNYLQEKEQRIIESEFNRPVYENYGLSGVSNRPFYRT